ncbi:MAG: hypothetical protein R2814_08970 [Flavobacteriaceae bacterium]
MKNAVNTLITTNEPLEGPEEDVMYLVAEIPICSFSGEPADYYIGLSGPDYHDEIRLIGAIGSKFVETAIINVMGQGVEHIQWPVILDLNKRIYYHSHQAHLKGLSAIMGWKEFLISK